MDFIRQVETTLRWGFLKASIQGQLQSADGVNSRERSKFSMATFLSLAICNKMRCRHDFPLPTNSHAALCNAHAQFNNRTLRSPASPSDAHAVPDSLDRVQSRPNVQIDGHIVVLRGFTAIVVNDIANLPPTPVHYPIMAVKWQLIPATNQFMREREKG